MELVTEVVVVPPVEPRIGTGGRHAQHVTQGVDDQHRLLVFGLLERVVQVQHQVVNVERHPTYGKDEGDRDKQRVESPQSLYKQIKITITYFPQIADTIS